jgi:hypothetical protein
MGNSVDVKKNGTSAERACPIVVVFDADGIL